MVVLAGCAEPIDLTRPEIERGTLGEEIYRQLERDLARTRINSSAKAEAFRAQCEDFIWAVDRILPDSEIPGFEDLALDLLPFMDDDTLPDLVRKLAFIYEDVANDPAVRAAWARSHRLRTGLTHSAAESDLIERLVSYPRLRELTEFTVDLILEHDGLAPDGQPAPAENDFLHRLQLSIRDSLNNPDDPTDLHRNIAVVTELLLEPDPRFAQVGELQPLWAIRPDARGVPRVAWLPEGGLPLSFTDADGDGMADVDAQGAYLDREGSAFFLEPYGEPGDVFDFRPGLRVGRDEVGRAFEAQSGQYVYDYLDLNQTALGYLLRRTPELVERSILTDTFVGLEGLLGELDTSGEYPHYTTNTALMDLLDAVFQVARFTDLPELLEIVALLLRDHESTLASLLLVAEDNGDINDRLGAHLEPNNGFVDDLLPYLYEFSQDEGFLDDLLTALQDPIIDDMAVAFADMNATFNPAIRLELDGPYNTSVAPCLEQYEVGTEERFNCVRAADTFEIFAGDVDHTRPEGPGNTSLQQRVLHLIYDGTGWPFSMEIVELNVLGLDLSDLAEDIGPMLTIDDVVAAFFDSIAGNFCIRDTVNTERILENNLLSAVFDLAQFLELTGDQPLEDTVADIMVFLSDSLGVHLDECPTPQQLIRFFNLPRLEIDEGWFYARLADAYDREGYLFPEHHADSLYAAEASGLIDGLRPVMQVFSDRGLTPRLGAMIAALYRHYPGPTIIYNDAEGNPLDLEYSGLRRHEPALIEIFREERMLPLTQELAGILQALKLSSDQSAPEVLEDLLLHLLDTEAGVYNRRGETTHIRGDGRSTPMNRYYLLVGGMDALDEALEANPESDEAWERASDELVDLMFDVVDAGEGRGRFEDPGSAALGTVVTAHLARHLRRYRDAGTMLTRLRENYPDYVERLITSRGFAAVVQMVQDVRSEPADQALFDDFLTHLTETGEGGSRSGLALLYQLLLGTCDQVGYMEVAPWYVLLVDPTRRFAVDSTPELPLLTHGALLLRDVLAVDPDDVGIELLRRAAVAPSAGEGRTTHDICPSGFEPAALATEAPLSILARAIRQVHRLEPGHDGPMSVEDLEHQYTSLYEFIRDDFRGLERVFELIQDRSGVRPAEAR